MKYTQKNNQQLCNEVNILALIPTGPRNTKTQDPRTLPHKQNSSEFTGLDLFCSLFCCVFIFFCHSKEHLNALVGFHLSLNFVAAWRAPLPIRKGAHRLTWHPPPPPVPTDPSARLPAVRCNTYSFCALPLSALGVTSSLHFCKNFRIISLSSI